MTPLALVSSVIVGILTLIGGVLGAWLKFSTDRQSATSADWQAFTDRIQKQVDGQGEEIDKLKEKISALETQVTKWKNRYWVAIDHIRDLRLSHSNPPDLPEIIAHDLEQAT